MKIRAGGVDNCPDDAKNEDDGFCACTVQLLQILFYIKNK